MVLRGAALCLFIAVACHVSVRAEDLIYDLGEIVVTEDETPRVAVLSTAEVSSRDIAMRNAATVDSALDFTPGVRVTVGQKNEPYVTVRGFNQDKVLVLLDGVPVASPYYGYVDLNQIPVESISKIKVIKGAASPLYGANAMGGVVNIVTKESGEKPYLELQSGFSDRRTRHYAVSCGAAYKGFSYGVHAGSQRSDGFDLSSAFRSQPNEGGGRRDNSDYEKKSFHAKLGLESDEGEKGISASFSYIDNEKGIPPHVSSNRPRYWRFTEWKRWMTTLAGQSALTDMISVKGRVFYDKYDNTLASYDNALYTTQSGRASWTSIYDEYALGSGTYLSFDPHPSHSLEGAVNFKRDVHKEQGDTGDPWELYVIHTYSFGCEYEMRPVDSLVISTGFSYDTLCKLETSTGEAGGENGSLNPVATVKYYVNPGTLVYGSLAQKTRFPTMHQLYSATSGNPDLTEQRNTNYEIGVHCDVEGYGSVGASYFHNDVKDLIDRASRNDLYLNISKALFEGVEARASAKIGKYLNGSIGYTYLDAIDRDPGILGRSGKEIQYVPKHKTDIELIFRTDFGLSGTFLGAYNGRRYYYDGNNNRSAMGGYFVAHAKLSQRFFEHWEVSLSVENIFDRNYQEEEGYPQPGRTFFLEGKAIF